ncbi:hypothetical protein JTB14_001951 [Gonioctena quinquepunctata]|nr:hypothetical protein JTB14_001951 [Gonioctena quinquepunctata]
MKTAFHDHIRTTYPTTRTVIPFCVRYATRRILTVIPQASRRKKMKMNPMHTTEQTAKNIGGVAKEVHGIGTRKKKVMETYVEENERDICGRKRKELC